jgi:hypothetical protein
MESHRQESFVDSGLLSVLSVSLVNQMKCDILYSLLASQLKASIKFPNASEFSQRYGVFIEALTQSAWLLRREQVLKPLFENQASVTLTDVITRAMVDGSLQSECELACEAIDDLARLPTDSLIQAQQLSQRTVKVPDGGEEPRFTVHLLFAVSTKNARIEVFYLEFETKQNVGEHCLEQAFSTCSFTSPIVVKHHSFEMAARAFSKSREHIVAFVQGHALMAVRPRLELSQEPMSCGAVRAPDSPSPR